MLKTSSNKSGLTRHEKHCLKNPDFVPNSGGRQGLKGDPRLKHTIETRKKLSNVVPGIASTPDRELARRRKISEKAKENNGGYRQGSGRGKKGWYNGIFCDSSWELAYLIYCLDHNISILRNTEKRQYEFNGKKHYYIPDFIVEGCVVEIKGYKTEQWLAKISANPDVKVLYKDDLEYVFCYVINKYGRDYVKLYGR